ncbi:hypothetical protein J3R83DRAFT_3948 [Lanmaoa asiatica]|nr:hypothetical protein J3R83DRAFT_3948 [Lanmaoa asiatica]
MDILSHFGELDELIQVIYQGFDRFIVLSAVSGSSWTVYVGLKGPEGRWWRGSWSAQDISQFVVRPAAYFWCFTFRRIDGCFHVGFKAELPNPGKSRSQPVGGICEW